MEDRCNVEIIVTPEGYYSVYRVNDDGTLDIVATGQVGGWVIRNYASNGTLAQDS